MKSVDADDDKAEINELRTNKAFLNCVELLLDVLFQSCGNDDVIDNQCTSAYEDACIFLCEQGILTKINSRIYEINKVFQKINGDCSTCKHYINNFNQKDNKWGHCLPNLQKRCKYGKMDEVKKDEG